MAFFCKNPPVRVVHFTPAGCCVWRLRPSENLGQSSEEDVNEVVTLGESQKNAWGKEFCGIRTDNGCFTIDDCRLLPRAGPSLTPSIRIIDFKSSFMDALFASRSRSHC